MENFEALTFFLGPTLFAMSGYFNCVDVAPGSLLPSAIFVSSTSCPCEDVGWSSSTFTITSSVAYAITVSTILFCSVTFYVASRATFSLAATVSYHLFSANCVMHNLASSFFFCATTFSSFTKSRVRHSRGHVSKTVKMAWSVAINGSFVHCFVVSLRTLMYTL